MTFASVVKCDRNLMEGWILACGKLKPKMCW